MMGRPLEVVDRQVFEAIRLEGRALGLALDVLPVEPVAAGSRLAVHPRAILTPHSAFYSVESERELRRKAAQNLVTWLSTGRPDYVVTAGMRKP